LSVDFDRRSGWLQRLRVALAWHPEWTLVATAVAAWIVLVVFNGSLSHGPGMHTMDGPAVPRLPTMHAGHVLLEPHQENPPSVIEFMTRSLAAWFVMCAAMMTPSALRAAQHVGLNSVRSRRHRAVALFTGAYLLVWVAFGVLALSLVGLARNVDHRAIAVVAFSVAAAWQFTRGKRRAVNACLRPVALPPLALRADVADVRFGALHGVRCAQSCWALMLLMAAIGHANLLAMLGLTLVAASEEFVPLGRRLVKPVGGALGMLAVVVAIAP
jgi:predicted metal-binding membrane protein